ncbi:FAD binding domain-containing protein [Schizophyllum amplum]|uniref:FAD binding domain-containing protein n=1 Tax=Schizophyllum amplum TaxID=97359 RepID=A0A550CGR5_9AGAR|nr:FAD binding domain-containing protein [Auriculariopsis ampla]
MRTSCSQIPRRIVMPSNEQLSFDCVVIGSGHAGSCAALSAVQFGCKKVLVTDKCPPEWAGGNGLFTAGTMRTAHGGLKDLAPLVCNAPPEIMEKIDLDAYSAEEFRADIDRLGQGQADPHLVEAVVRGSRDAVQWLSQSVRVPFILSFHRQAYEVDGRRKFWGGMALAVQDGGKGLIRAHHERLREAGVELRYESAAVELLTDGDRGISGVVLRSRDGTDVRVSTPSVVLACGGFEASPDLRAKYLGERWAHARIRGTPYNTGDALGLAEGVGAKLTGDFAGCHSTTWDAHASLSAGDLALTNAYTKSGYPLGIMVNAHGERFVDEGEDFRNYTYAKFGRAILEQPESIAFQVFDARMTPKLRQEEYGDDIVRKVTANSIEELANQLVAQGLKDKRKFVETVETFNKAVRLHQAEHRERALDIAVKDGMATQSSQMSLSVPKTNWASALEVPPFVSVAVTCGITFTFGGLAVDPETSGVMSKAGAGPIRGLFATGEAVGGLFYNNYPGGSGLTAGAVLGRKAGRYAAERAKLA